MAGVTTAAAAAPDVPAAPVTPPAPADPKPAAPADPATDPKKDRKPRRERLPLPDPLPTTPVKRYPEPSRADLQTAVEAEDAKLQVCFDRLNSTRAFSDARQKIRDDTRPAFDAARKEFNKRSDECRALFDEKKEITNKLKAIKEADFAARAAANAGGNEVAGVGKDGAEALRGVKNMKELEDRIKELEYLHSTRSMGIVEEKRLVSQISFLNHGGKELIMGRDKSYKDEKAAKEVRLSTRQELEAARTKLDAQIDAAKAKADEQKKVVDAVRMKQDAEIKKLEESTTSIDRDQEKKKIGEIKAIIRDMREEFQVKLDEWYLNERIYYEQQKIAKKKKYEAAQAERDARRKAWEAEQAQYPEPDPYQQEKDMCSGLTVYLQTILGETVEKPSVNLRPTEDGSAAPSLKTSSNTREITAKGKAIGKSTTGYTDGFESLAFSDFVKKGGSRSKGKKGRRTAAAPGQEASAEVADMPLKPHSIDYLAAFTTLDIKPPNKISEVRDALEAVKSKKSYYDSAPKPSEEDKAKMAAKKSKKQAAMSSEKQPKNNGMDLMNGDGGAVAFPQLHADNAASGPSPALVRDNAGPSFMDVASGAAPAPAPAAPVAPTVSMEPAGEDKDAMEGNSISPDMTISDDQVRSSDPIVGEQETSAV